MLYLSFIWHMHQPYYNNLLTHEADLPWVRMHGIKDYVDMVTILGNFENIHQTFNLVPSLIEQIDSYLNSNSTDKFLRLSRKRVDLLSKEEKQFIIENFFMVDAQRILALHPRYYELYLNSKEDRDFSVQEILDLQVWFNLAWFDPDFINDIEELNFLSRKARFFSEEEKNIVLDKQLEILKRIIPTYREFQQKGQIEISISPFYHPILPLLYNSKIAKEANKDTVLAKDTFSYVEDCQWQIREALKYYKEIFEREPIGMWPSEEAISNQIVSLFIENKLNWIVTDEELLLRSLRKRSPKKKIERGDAIYKSYSIEESKGLLNILFRDRQLSDLIGFVYQNWDTEKAVDDFMFHLKSINEYFRNNDCLVVVALDGENAWEYYKNDGKDFLNLLYKKISDSKYIKAITVSEYLQIKPQSERLTKIASGSWINGDFLKWIGNPIKNKAWDLLNEARRILDKIKNPPELAWKQIYILEGSDWFWWYGEKQRQFDSLFRMHLKNFYQIIGQIPTVNLDEPLE